MSSQWKLTSRSRRQENNNRCLLFQLICFSLLASTTRHSYHCWQPTMVIHYRPKNRPKKRLEVAVSFSLALLLLFQFQNNQLPTSPIDFKCETKKELQQQHSDSFPFRLETKRGVGLGMFGFHHHRGGTTPLVKFKNYSRTQVSTLWVHQQANVPFSL